MSGAHDPFAAIAEPAQNQTADPFASIAEKPEAAPPADTGFHPLKDLTAWGERTFPHLSAQDVKTNPELQKFDTVKQHPGLVRLLFNTGTTAAKTITSAPEAVADAVMNASWTPAQYQKKQQAAGGTPFDPKKASITPEQVSDYTSEQGGKVLGGVALGEAGGAALEGVKGVGKLIPKVGRAAIDKIANTGPSVAGKLVEETRGENQEIRTSNADAARDHLDATLDALHKTQGSELQHQQAVKAANDAAQAAQRAVDAEHEQAVQKALQETREKEDLYQQELRKAKLESDEAYRKKVTEVEKQRADAEKTRRQELHKYLDKKAKIQSDFTAAQEKFKADSAKQAKIAPTQTKLQAAWSNLRAGIETAREKASQIGNEKYTTVRKELNNIPGDTSKLTKAYGEAMHSLGEAGVPPPLLKRVEEFTKNPITYKDEQILYSELGKELSKGTLSGGTYHVYDLLHEAIGDDMQRIADSKGMGKELSEARNYWKRMKQTFGREFGGGDAATKTLNTAAPNIASAEDQAKRINLLGSFDSRLPGMFEHVQNLQQGAESLPAPVPEKARLKSLVDARKPLPQPPSRNAPIPNPEPVAPKPVAAPPRVEPPDRPATIQPNIPQPTDRVAPPDRPETTAEKKIGLEDIRSRKLKSLTEEGIPGVRKVGHRIVNYGVGLKALWDTFHLRVGDVAEDVGIGAAGYGATEAFARMLERPGVQELLTKPTAADLAQIPPELRGNLGPMLDAAQKKGIKVDPRLYAVAGLAAPKKGVAGALGKKYQQTATRSDGHKIGTNDGKTWFDVNTGEPANGNQ